MCKPPVLWVDLTLATRESELPELFDREFDISPVVDFSNVESAIEESPACGVFFDFDYPDRQRLSQLVDLKRAYPSTPMIMMTLQHSESLAIWAYRNGVLDYLLKPVSKDDQRRCIGRISEIYEAKNDRSRRRLPYARAPMPADVPATSKNVGCKLAPAIHYVQQNYSSRIYSDTVARLCDVSASQFSRAFRQNYGLTFQEFLLRYRVAEACRMLRAPGSSISDVAYGVGFSDGSYFTRVFRRYVGVSPSEYCSMGDQTDNEVRLQEIANSTDLAASQTVRELVRAFA